MQLRLLLTETHDAEHKDSQHDIQNKDIQLNGMQHINIEHKAIHPDFAEVIIRLHILVNMLNPY